MFHLQYTCLPLRFDQYLDVVWICCGTPSGSRQADIIELMPIPKRPKSWPREGDGIQAEKRLRYDVDRALVEDGNAGTDSNNVVHLLAFGDSLTAGGFGSKPYPAQLQALLQERGEKDE